MKVAKLGLLVAAALFLTSTFVSATIHNVNAGPGWDFFPANLVIVSGDTVHWTVVEGIHTTTSTVASPKTWDSGNMGVGGTFDVVFTAGDGTGPFPYRCELHYSLGMTGVIYIDNDSDGVTADIDCDDADPGVGVCLPCCIGVRGNANHDPEEKVTLSDLVYLVKYFFNIPPGPAPVCIEEANMNGDPDETLNISDITYLVKYLFGIPTGPAPPACP